MSIIASAVLSIIFLKRIKISCSVRSERGLRRAKISRQTPSAANRECFAGELVIEHVECDQEYVRMKFGSRSTMKGKLEGEGEREGLLEANKRVRT